MARRQRDQHGDALDELERQDEIVEHLLDVWGKGTDDLGRTSSSDESVEIRWERGSAVKLLLQHLAVREAATRSIVERLGEVGSYDLAERLDGAGPRRREAVARLDELERGRMAMSLNDPQVDEAVADLGELFGNEHRAGGQALLGEVGQALGRSGQRGLPSARSVRMRSVTHPHPTPKWYDRIAPLNALRALYDHLRGTPSGLTSPKVDDGREFTPGPRR